MYYVALLNLVETTKGLFFLTLFFFNTKQLTVRISVRYVYDTDNTQKITHYLKISHHVIIAIAMMKESEHLSHLSATASTSMPVGVIEYTIESDVWGV